MNLTVCHGESGGCSVGPSPFLRILLAGMALACAGLAWSAPARARTMYRCAGAHGEAVFTSSSVGYRNCHHLRGIAPRADRSSVRSAAVRAPQTRADVTSTGHHADKKRTPAKPLKANETIQADHPGARIRRGAVYRIRHADGTTEYTNVRPRNAHKKAVKTLFSYIATCVACDVRSNIDWHTVPLHTVVYAAAIRRAAADYAVSTSLLRAVIHAESAFNPRALSSKGAQGLMQLMPSTASAMGVSHPFDAAQNIRGGARYLAELLRDFHGDARLAAAAYNAGPQTVREYGDVPPYTETRMYVKRVGILRKRYAAALPAADVATTGQAGATAPDHGPAS